MSENQSTYEIKNMVCPRCIIKVREAFESLGFSVQQVELGQVLVEPDASISRAEVDAKLQEAGFELITERDEKVAEQIKSKLITYAEEIEENENAPKLSAYLSEKLHQNYSSLSTLFSDHEGVTIEKYLIQLKIERVKELLSCDDMTLADIAFKLNYSSASYLSRQFKQTTGMSVTDFKHSDDFARKSGCNRN